MTKTVPQDAEAWADAQVQRHRRAGSGWPLDILGTGPRCTGNCKQGRALCVHPEACGVQRPVAEAATYIGADDQDAAEDFKRPPLLSEAGRFWLGYVAFIAAVALAGVLTLINHAPKP